MNTKEGETSVYKPHSLSRFSKSEEQSVQSWYWPLVLLSCTFQLVSDVTAGKLILLGGIEISVSVLYFPMTYIISDILTEVYGYEKARRALLYMLGSSILAGVIYQAVMILPSGPHFHGEESYKTVLGTMPRVLLAGWIAVFWGDISNNYVLSRLKVLTKGKFLWLRTIGSTIVGQGVNTLVFFAGAFYEVLPHDVLLLSIFWGACIKIGVEILFTPLTYVVIRVVKNHERVDCFDIGTNYNPFRI